jgi:hypothetical protein
MRKFLLATVCLTAVSGPAYAIDLVLDPVQEAQGVMELARWVEQIAAMKQQYDQLVYTYNALSHATDLSGVASALGGITRTYMPEASAIPDLMADAGYLWGRAGQFNDHDAYYVSAMIDRWSAEMERRRAVTSNAKGMAAASTMDAQEHLMRLGELQARLAAAVDVTEVSAINGYIALEQQNLDAHRAQMENIRLMLAADDRVNVQREDQRQRESAELLMQMTAPIKDDLR